MGINIINLNQKVQEREYLQNNYKGQVHKRKNTSYSKNKY